MANKMGLVRVRCRECKREDIMLLDEFMAAEALTCETCSTLHRVERILAEDVRLASLVRIMRQLETFRVAKIARDEARLIEASRQLHGAEAASLAVLSAA